MIVVQSTFRLHPGSEEEVLKLMQNMMRLCQEERGCMSYEYFASLEDPNRIILVQEWETSEDLQEHYQTAHMEEFLAKLGGYLKAPISSRSYASEPAKKESKETKSTRSRSPSAGQTIH